MDLLFEIGMEENPARFLEPALNDIKNNISKFFREERLKYDDISVYGTPRRLVLFVKNLIEQQEDVNEVVLGPSITVAYKDGELTKAGLGFLKSQSADPSSIQIIENEKGKYISLKKYIKGKETKEILPDILKKLVLNLAFPKSMKWSDKSLRFARPIEWFLALYGNEVIDFEIEGIKSSNKSKGHRFFGKEFEIKNIDEYFTKIRENNVIIDIQERKNLILESINKSLNDGEKVDINDALLSEVTNLVEYPYPIIGNFNPEFLAVPQEVLIITMQVHQRYFPIIDSNGKLLPKFIVIRNGIDYSENVKTGNEKVLSARLADARFFYDEDLKIKLSDNIEKLKTVVFQKDLGTIYEKIERMEEISNFIINKLNLKNKEDILKVVKLCKADLVSNMIGEKEFTKLQGFMGAEYALKQGEKNNVSLGIKEHYYPRFQGDILPTTTEGIVVGIADRLDTLVGCFGVGVIPTGSKDPFALRRAALGILNIMLSSKLDIDINDLLELSLNIYDRNKILKSDREIVRKDVLDFLKQRLLNILSEMNHNKNIINSVLNVQFDNPTDILNKVKIIEEYLEKEEFRKLLLAVKRVYNISDKTIEINVEENLFENEFEQKLWSASKKLDDETRSFVERREYKNYMESLLEITDVIDDYFANVKVMSDNEKVKKNRISQLNYLIEVFSRIFDISLILED